MDVKDLRYFIAVYRTRSFSRAATELHTVQSNVSGRILALERTLRAPLFKRLHRLVEPTPLGKRFYLRAIRVVASMDVLERSAKRRRRAI